MSELRKVLETFIPDDIQFVHGMQRSDENSAFVNEVVNAVNKVYEADRQRTREVVQSLVDGIETMRQGAFADAFIFANDAELDAHAKKLLALAKSQLQIEPKP